MTKPKALTAQDCELLTKNAGLPRFVLEGYGWGESGPLDAGYLRQHAAALFKMPTGDQFMGGRDTVLHSALIQIAECLERLAK